MLDQWLWNITDMLASEYGWAKRDILETVYVDELFHYQKNIRARIRLKRIYDLRIAHNPYLKPRDQKALMDELAQDTDGQERPAKLDKGAFELLRGQLSGNPKSKFHVK